MAKMIPLGGFLMSGKVGDAVFCRRGNGAYVRARVVPTNPRTPAQVEQRRRFEEAVAAWKALDEKEKDRYRKMGEYSGRTGYNLFVGEYLANYVESG